MKFFISLNHPYKYLSKYIYTQIFIYDTIYSLECFTNEHFSIKLIYDNYQSIIQYYYFHWYHMILFDTDFQFFRKKFFEQTL